MRQCNKCKSKIGNVAGADGLPNGLGFVLENGKEITLCAECIMELGRLKEAGDKAALDAFFQDLGVDHE